MENRIKIILEELKAGLDNLYGERLRDLVLFGSYARDEADEESDIDILIVLDLLDNYSREIERTSQVVSAVSLKHGISVSRVFSTHEQWQEADNLFVENVRQEAVHV